MTWKVKKVVTISKIHKTAFLGIEDQEIYENQFENYLLLAHQHASTPRTWFSRLAIDMIFSYSWHFFTNVLSILTLQLSLLNHMVGVLACSLALCACVLACVFSMLACLRAYVLAWLMCSHAYVLICLLAC